MASVNIKKCERQETRPVEFELKQTESLSKHFGEKSDQDDIREAFRCHIVS